MYNVYNHVLCVTKKLQIEKELRGTLIQWEEDHERYFLVEDTRFLDTIQEQWEERSSSKEKEKMKRVSCGCVPCSVCLGVLYIECVCVCVDECVLLYCVCDCD